MGTLNFLRLLLGIAIPLAFAGAVFAQNPFAPVATVNDRLITEFEVQQRQGFLITLNAPGSTREAVIDELINERLRAETIENAGLELTEEALEAGLAEFAARANVSVEEFIEVLAANGIAEETFRDFVEIGVAWRDFISSQFGARLQVSESEIDRALGSSSSATAIRVLLSEIIIPAPPEQLQQVEALAFEIAEAQSADEFSDYAREFSATATRDQGGRLPWQSLTELPPVLRPILLGLAPGEITDPIPIPNAIALFQLRGIEETGAPAAEYAAIEYATYFIPGGRSEKALKQAAEVRANVDVCNDLYGIAFGQPEEVLERVTQKPSEIPSDIAFELSKLDPGESSTALTRANGQNLVFLMLCGRTALANEEVERAEVAAALRSNRLNTFAESYLAQIRADARIEYQ